MYMPTTGRFNKLDPFLGDFENPQSLHKYAYAHADPVNSADPTGEFAVTIGFVIGGFYAGNIRAQKVGADLQAQTTAMGILHVYARMAAWRIGGMLGGALVSGFVPRFQGYLSVSSDDEDYAANLPVPATTNERSVNNRAAIDAATTVTNRQRMVTVLKTVRNTQRHSLGIDTCFHCREKLAQRIRALGQAFYDNDEYVIKRIQWTIDPSVGGWEDHFGLVVISKATGQRVVYIDNGSFGDSSGAWPAQVGGLFTTVPETFFGSGVSQEGSLIDLDL
jgi:hypothetical protein